MTDHGCKIQYRLMFYTDMCIVQYRFMVYVDMCMIQDRLMFYAGNVSTFNLYCIRQYKLMFYTYNVLPLTNCNPCYPSKCSVETGHLKVFLFTIIIGVKILLK